MRGALTLLSLTVALAGLLVATQQAEIIRLQRAAIDREMARTAEVEKMFSEFREFRQSVREAERDAKRARAARQRAEEDASAVAGERLRVRGIDPEGRGNGHSGDSRGSQKN